MNFKAIPKTHLHLHLEGAVPLSTGKDFYARRHPNEARISLDEFKNKIQMSGGEKDFSEFLAKFSYVFDRDTTTEDLRRITSEIIEDQIADGVRYLELRFCPNSFEQRTGISPEASLTSILEEINKKNDSLDSCYTRFITIIDQRLGAQTADNLFQTVYDNAFLRENVCAFDIASDPFTIPLDNYALVCKKIHDAGFHLTVHAGELIGSDSIKTAIELLGAERIGHGIHAIEDPYVLNLLKEREIPLEICLMSNFYTKAVRCLAEHPMKKMMDAGIKITLNTDDPMVFGKKLSEEYILANLLWDFSPHDYYQINKNGIQYAFIDAEIKNKLFQEFDQIWDKLPEKNW